jgi:diguanylate cyclase
MKMPPQESDFQKTKEIIKKVLLSMGEQHIPPTPENYQVWYEYCVGSNAGLVHEINEITKRCQPFTDTVNDALYSKYFGREREERLSAEIQRKTQKILKDILEEVLNTNNETAQYGKKLQGYSRKLNAAREIREMQQIIKDLLEETGKMEQASSSLQKKLEEATDEAQKLRQKLEKKEREALLDVLTGLHNRKAFGRTLQELHDAYKEKGTIFSLIMLDIDFFKKFNDTYGHKIGDEVLHIVGTTLKECIKGKDLAARYGGEEFAVLLPATTLANALTVAEQIRHEFAGKTLKLKKTGEKIGNINCSLGISQIQAHDSTDTVVERADQALYLAKHSGRNNTKTERDLAYIATAYK